MAFSIHMTGKVKLKLPGYSRNQLVVERQDNMTDMTDFLCLGVQKFESVRGEKHNHLLVFNQDHGAENKTLSKNLKLLLQGER